MNRYLNTIRTITAQHDRIERGELTGPRRTLDRIDASSFAGGQREMVERMHRAALSKLQAYEQSGAERMRQFYSETVGGSVLADYEAGNVVTIEVS